MEEKKLAVDVQKRELAQHVQRMDSPVEKLELRQTENSRIYGDGLNDNWYELRFQSLGPDRRGYHSTFIHNKRLYIYGGHDIREGSKDSLWTLELRKLKDLDLDPQHQQKDCAWKEVDTKGEEKPGPLAHHTSVIYGDKMFLFGGSNLEAENRKFFSLDLNHFRWELVKSRGDLPITRDEHTAVIYENEHSMIIFGGFMNGQRTNEIVKYLFQENRWQKMNISAQNIQPSPRSGHSAVIYENAMYVFGGKDDDNNKLNDLWRLDLNTYAWSLIKTADNIMPLERSGHTCDIYEGYMIVFGGIFEITKELNDFYLYDFKNNKWITLFEESNSPLKVREASPNFEDSPNYGTTGGMSPNKRPNLSPAGRLSNMKSGSPVKTSMGVAKQTKATQQIKKNLNLNQSLNQQSNSRNQKTSLSAITGIQLSTPTSISMMNSFIIKNADSSFDQYYASMKKRKQFNHQSPTFNNNHSTTNIDNNYGKNKGKRPAARDGHTGVIFGKYFIVFGGDRHHMPFNDTFVLDVKSETMSKSFLFS